MNKSALPIAQLYPPDDRDALIVAARSHSLSMIDAVTDALASRGECRPRHDDSRADEWAAMRPTLG